MKQNFIFTLLALFSMLSLVSCSDWTETEALDSTVKKPWEQILPYGPSTPRH